MRPKRYATKKVEEVFTVLEKAPEITPRFLSHEDALKKLSQIIRDLHEKKHYDAKDITAILKENGIKTSLREIREMLSKIHNKNNMKNSKITP